MINDFLQKSFDVIEYSRSQNISSSTLKDLSFNLVSPKLSSSKLPNSDSNFLILATEVFVLTPESKILCEQWIFQFQPHERRKDLNIIQTMEKLE